MASRQGVCVLITADALSTTINFRRPKNGGAVHIFLQKFRTRSLKAISRKF